MLNDNHVAAVRGGKATRNTATRGVEPGTEFAPFGFTLAAGGSGGNALVYTAAVGKKDWAFWLAVAFWCALLCSRLLLVTRDIGATHLPWRQEWARQVGKGWLPLWNPRANGGRFLWADPNSQAAYPLTALFLLLPEGTAMTVFLALHHLWLMAGLAFLAKCGGVPGPETRASAALLATSGVAFSLTTFPNALASASWVPWAWALLAGNQQEGTRATRRSLAAGGLLGLSFLAGEPVTAALGLAGSILLALRPKRPWASWGLLGLGFFAIALPVLLPLLQVFPETVRGAQSVSEGALAADCLAPRRWVELLFPRVLGEPLGDVRTGFWAAASFPWQRYYPLVFFGAAAFYLLVVGVRRMGRRAVPWVGLLSLGLGLALLPAWGWGAQLLRRVPGGAFWRFAIKGLQLTLFAAAPLVAAGLEATRRKKRFWLLPLAALFLLPPLFPQATRRLFGHLYPASQPALASVKARTWQGWWLADGLTNAVPLGFLALGPQPALAGLAFSLAHWPLFSTTHHPVLQARWQEPPALVRSGTLAPGTTLLVLTASAPQATQPIEATWAFRELLVPDYGLSFGLAYAAARGPDGLELERGELLAAWASQRPASEQLQLAAALGAGALLTEKPWAGGPCQSLGDALFCRASRFSPPFYLARRAFPAESLPATAVWLASSAFVPGEDVTLAHIPSPTAFAAGSVCELPGAPHHRRFWVRAPGETLLVVQQNFSKAWRGRVDGQLVPVQPANWVRLGLKVPAGEHQVELFLDLRPYVLGLFGPILYLTAWLWLRKRVPQEPNDGPERSTQAREPRP